MKGLNIYSIEGKKVIHSFEYYKAAGLKRGNYSRWMMESVINVGEPGVDYFPIPGNTVGRTIRFRLRYYFEIDFAIAICLIVKRREAMEIRKFLLESKGIKIDDNIVRPDISSSKIPFRNFNKPPEE